MARKPETSGIPMRILKLEMDGFKSFGRHTVFEFPAQITGVVGPNGCGKSNVVDATRWVLGEMSRKALRAKSNTDVIFSGSATRKPARYAEVSITFDNSDGVLPFSSKQVKVSRRLEKNGDSFYSINDEPAKMRDVRGLFEGTGAAMSAYSIMEQGKMDRLLQANQDERRLVFEEAAGIGQMRKQQEAAQAKLLVVDQNLERLQSILGEVKGQLRKIKTAASRALKYTELKERSRVIHQDLALVQFSGLDKQREELLATISAAGKREGAIQADLAKTKMDLEDAETRLADAEHEERRLSERIHKLDLEISQQQAKREKALARVESLKQAIERAKELSERVRAQMAGLKSRRETISATAEAGRAELQQLVAHVAKLAADEQAAREEAEAMEARLKQVRTELLDAITAANQGLNERMGLDAEMRSARRRLESLAARATEAGREGADVSTRLEAARSAREQDEAALKAVRDELAETEKLLGPIGESANEMRQRKHALELKRGAKLERKAMLESMAAMREGLDDNARALLEDEKRRASFGIMGVFADALRVDLGFAAALERVLKDLGTAIIVDNIEHAHDLFDWLAGRGSCNLSILAQSEFKSPEKFPQFPGGKGVIGPLLDEVRVEEGFGPLAEALVGDVLLVADRTVARRLMQSGASGFRIVTPTGEMFSLPGSFALAGGEANTGLITQQSEIERLRHDLGVLDSEIEETAAKLAESLREQDKLAAAASDLRARIYDASMEAAGKRVALDALAREHKRLEEERAVLASETAGLQQQLDADLKRHTELTEQVAAAEEAKGRCERELAALAEDVAARREALQEARSALTEARVTEASRRTEQKQAEDSLKGIDQALARYAEEIALSAGEVEAHAKEIRKLEHEAGSSIEVEAELEREKRELDERRGSGGQLLAERRREVEHAREHVAELQEQLYRERESVQQARIDENTLFMKMDAIRRRLAENFNADIDTLYRDYDPAARSINENEARAELESLEEQIRRLGNVNMEAMDELKEAEERNSFYTRQEQDLLKAKRTLSDAIARIENETRRMFMETFEAVRSNFQRLFRRLFGGGSADIMLTNPEVPLASGVEIICKPPGKEALPIAMRSGGERAMISVAMMFAIYETNPAPYAILDEVDAPLDEANVDRFCSVIEDYAKYSQFIIITHHKKTMAACDTLYGVTMQEPGTSTKVSVDLRGAAEPELLEASA
ncbi:MAG: chromosome segregation protein SMC [Planctomycetes bacterium]|nr:chromosome segregation protein SMC [Planctomycetota bacterium]